MERPRDEVENIKAAALLHDIGKVEVSMELIQKAASLSDEEKHEIDTHSERGAKILLSVGDVLKEAVPIVLAHHKSYRDLYENNDRSLKDDAKIGACIVSVADTYDAITSDRPYRAGKTPWKAVEEIEEGSGKEYHPKVVEAFRRVLSIRVEDNAFLIMTHKGLSGNNCYILVPIHPVLLCCSSVEYVKCSPSSRHDGQAPRPQNL